MYNCIFYIHNFKQSPLLCIYSVSINKVCFKKSLMKAHRPPTHTLICLAVCLVSLIVSAGAHCGPVISPVNALGQLSCWNVNLTDGVTSRLTMRGRKKNSRLLTLEATLSTQTHPLFCHPSFVCVIPGVGQITDQSVTHSPGILPPSAPPPPPPPPQILSVSVCVWLSSSVCLSLVCATWPHCPKITQQCQRACQSVFFFSSLLPLVSMATGKVTESSRFVEINHSWMQSV